MVRSVQEPGAAGNEPPPETRSVVGPESMAMGDLLIISLTWEMHTPRGFLSPQSGAKFPLQPNPKWSPIHELFNLCCLTSEIN